MGMGFGSDEDDWRTATRGVGKTTTAVQGPTSKPVTALLRSSSNCHSGTFGVPVVATVATSIDPSHYDGIACPMASRRSIEPAAWDCCKALTLQGDVRLGILWSSTHPHGHHQ